MCNVGAEDYFLFSLVWFSILSCMFAGFMYCIFNVIMNVNAWGSAHLYEVIAMGTL